MTEVEQTLLFYWKENKHFASSPLTKISAGLIEWHCDIKAMRQKRSKTLKLIWHVESLARTWNCLQWHETFDSHHRDSCLKRSRLVMKLWSELALSNSLQRESLLISSPLCLLNCSYNTSVWYKHKCVKADIYKVHIWYNTYNITWLTLCVTFLSQNKENVNVRQKTTHGLYSQQLTKEKQSCVLIH